MNYEQTIETVTKVRLYLPDGTDNRELVAPILTKSGGGTTWVGKGCWRAPDGTLQVEDVGVLEFLIHHQADEIEQLVCMLGVAWMELNTREQCFLATVGDRQIKINRSN